MKEKPSLELALEIGQMYADAEEYSDALKWFDNKLLVNYSNEPAIYIFGIKTSIEAEDYKKAFLIHSTCKKKNISSDAIDELMKPIMYSYKIGNIYENVAYFTDSTGYAAIAKGNQWGFIDQKGSMIVRTDYKKAGMLVELAAVVDEEGVPSYIDARGNKKIPAAYFEKDDPEFGSIVEFKDIQSGMVLASNGKYWNYYSLETHQKLFGGFKDATVIANGIGAVSEDGKKWALINQDGTLLTDYIYDEVVGNEKGLISVNGVLFIKKDGVYYLIDDKGNAVNNSKYQKVNAFNDDSKAAVKKNGKWIFVDKDGKEYSLGDFQEAQSFSHDLAGVKIDNAWGYIDPSGKLVVENQYGGVKPVSAKGVTFVKEDASWKILTFYKDNYENM